MEIKKADGLTLMKALAMQWEEVKKSVASGRTNLIELLAFVFLTVLSAIFGFFLISLGLWGLLALLKCVVKSIF